MTLYLKKAHVPSIQEHIETHLDARPRVRFLEEGTRVTHKGRPARVNTFVPQDGWQIGITYDGSRNEGVIVPRSEVKPC